MNEPQDRRADNLDDAWSNFDPDIPLESGSPFFVQQEPPMLGSLKRALLRRHNMPQKYFLAGFKGSGKSTQINQLVSDSELKERYFITDFSIRETSDERNIDYVDLLVAIGSQIFTSYVDSGGELDDGLYRELDSWGRRVEERIKQVQGEAGAIVEAGVGAGLPWIVSFFGKLTAKIKTEFSTRTVIREVLEPQLTDLQRNIGLIATGIQARTKKNVLVFVDDTDKPLPEQAARLFKDHLAPLLQPNFYIVYTVPIWMYFSDEFPDIRAPKAFLLPNVRLYSRDEPDCLDSDGMNTMKDFVSMRMDLSLVDDNALDMAICMSGGVLREAARIMQMAIDRALEQEAPRVGLGHVENAVEDLRQGYRRLITDLTEDEIRTLQNIKETRQYQPGEQVSNLLNNLLVLEYLNGENWPDVNPILRDILP